MHVKGYSCWRWRAFERKLKCTIRAFAYDVPYLCASVSYKNLCASVNGDQIRWTLEGSFVFGNRKHILFTALVFSDQLIKSEFLFFYVHDSE
ncbi:hypothetical protein Syun_009802 [Stephania yunnanensis]|uniref:Uncharacterized protein n=1 Tax=Stephania yunnanensis TaxID=152371 RepID=A0AAP0PNZ0_9MAGN